MADSHLDPVLRYVEHRAVLAVLRRHPEWTLGQLFEHFERDGDRAAVLRELTLGDLFEDPDLPQLVMAIDGGPPIDRLRLRAAEELHGAEFDEVVRAVIDEAGQHRISAAYLRARVGGPRWKLQESLGRLVTAGVLERSGSTSGTRYRRADA
jgi:hypothetical protein